MFGNWTANTYTATGFNSYCRLTVTWECCGILRSTWALVIALFFSSCVRRSYQFTMNTSALVVQASYSWQNQHSLTQSSLYAVVTMLVPLSVARQAWFSTGRYQEPPLCFLRCGLCAETCFWGVGPSDTTPCLWNLPCSSCSVALCDWTTFCFFLELPYISRIWVQAWYGSLG